MRLGGPIFAAVSGPDEWARVVQSLGYRAAYCPLKSDVDDQTVQAYAEAARAADLVIAEVGSWSNPISTDEPTRRAAIVRCQQGLDLAERIGALCCVNIAGSRGPVWDGPHPDNLTDDTFDLIVQSVREIIDAVQPKRTFYTLETMPWAFPNNAQSYLRLLEALDRPAFAMHLDPVNLVNSPERFFSNAELIRECFDLLGPHIKGCHAKDIVLDSRLTVHLDEVRPGLGGLDYRTLLTEMNRLHPDTPLMLEHLPDASEYTAAAASVRAVAAELGISL